jgi:hypothetical protein
MKDMRINMAVSAAFVCTLLLIHKKITAIANMLIVWIRGY